MFETTRSISYSASTASQAKLSGPMPAFLQNPHILVDGDNDAGKVLKRQFMNDAETPMGNRSGKTPAGADGADCDLGDGLDNDNASTEDADDEDEDADDEDDGETAVHGPPGHGSIESSAFNNNLLQVPGHYDHRAGRNTNALKRSLSASLPRAQFSAADLERARASSAVLESGDEDEDSDTYPRSNLQRTYSNSSAIRRDREKDETDDYDIDIEDIEDLDSLGDLSDDDIEKEEEMAIIEELASEPSSPIAANSTFATMSDLGLDINGDLFSDSDFDYELPLDNSMVWSDRTLTSQFFDFPSMPSSPISQPHTPPASPTPYGLAHQVVQESFEVSSDTDTDSEIEDIDLLDSIVKEPVRRRVTWEDTETSEEDEVWDAFFAPSTDDEAEEEDDEEETGAEADAESGGDTTEEEEDLPMPTPKSKSIICRASDLPIPKNVAARYGRNCSPRPVAGNFLADGSRPICIINGTNKTYIVPTSKPIELDDDDSEVEMTFGLDHGVIQDSDIWEVTMELHDTDPTFGGMTGGDGGFMNGAQIIGPPEAFMNMDVVDDAKFMEVLDEYMSDGTPDESDSEGADILRLDDLLDISEDEDAEMSDTSMGTARRNSMSETQSQYQPDNEAEAMLSRWDQVSVTAFRKRQIAHQQRLNQRGGNSPGQRSRKLVGPDTTMTPIRKRRIKKRVVNAAGPPKKKVRREEEAFYDAIF